MKWWFAFFTDLAGLDPTKRCAMLGGVCHVFGKPRSTILVGHHPAHAIRLCDPRRYLGPIIVALIAQNIGPSLAQQTLGVTHYPLGPVLRS